MKNLRIAIALIAAVLITNTGFSHCQIPCGIYGDDARFTAMLEDVTTLHKSVKMINDTSTNKNQLVRWVVNKEHHADHIMDQCLNYFLAQRIKDSQADYAVRLAAVHKIIVLSMKAKQTADAQVITDLEGAIKAFQAIYNKK